MYYQPTPITWNNYHFLIMSAPDDSSMKRCIKVSSTREWGTGTQTLYAVNRLTTLLGSRKLQR